MYSKLSGFQLNIAKPITKDTNNPYGPVKTHVCLHVDGTLWGGDSYTKRSGMDAHYLAQGCI